MRLSGLAAALTSLALLIIPTAHAATPLVGTFRITAGSCSGGVSGSYFRMILPTGGAGDPYVANENSACRHYSCR